MIYVPVATKSLDRSIWIVLTNADNLITDDDAIGPCEGSLGSDILMCDSLIIVEAGAAVVLITTAGGLPTPDKLSIFLTALGGSFFS